MDAMPSLKKNYLLNTLLTGINILFPLVISAYAARVLGAQAMGSIYFAAGLTGYILVVTANAIPLYGVREIGKIRGDADRLGKVFSELFWLNLMLSFFAIALFLASVFFIPRFSQNLKVFLLMGGIILVQAFSVDYLFQGLERYGNLALRTILTKVLTMLLILVFVHGPGDYLIYAGIFSTGGLAGNLMGLFNIRRYTGLKFRGLDLRRHLRPLAPLLIFCLIGSIYINFDSILLGLLTDNYSVGIYNIGIRTTRTAITMISSLGVVLVPRFSFYLGNNHLDEHSLLVRRTVEYFYILTFAGAAFSFFSASALIPMVFGAGFSEAIRAVQISSPNIILVTMAAFLGVQILMPMGKESLLVWASLAGGAVSLALGLLLVPRLGYNGSAIASVGAEAASFSLLLALSRKHGVQVPFFEKRNLIYPLCSLCIAIPSSLAVWLCGSRSPVVLGACIAGVGLYFAAILGFRKELAAEALSLIRKRFPRKPAG